MIISGVAVEKIENIKE